jgi:hypothetical protein
MTGTMPATDNDVRLRTAINQDGLLDLFAGVTLMLSAGLVVAGWKVTGNPAMFATVVPVFFPLFFEPTRRRLTYPRLGCPEYKPTREITFALIAMTISAVLGLVVFLLTALTGIDVVRPFFEHAPAWAALGGSGMMVLLSWWYRTRRFLLYIVVAAAAVAAGYLSGSNMLVRLTILGGAVGFAMTFVGTVLLRRSLHSPAPA